MIVVADTSVLLNLCRVQQIELLRALFSDIFIPPEVAAEFARLSQNASRFQGLILPTWIHQQSASTRPAIPFVPQLHSGEVAALALAVEIRADAILIDERTGYAAAQQLGLKTIGLLGILLQAKAAGHLVAVRPVIDRLEQEARFWISPSVRERILKLARE